MYCSLLSAQEQIERTAVDLPSQRRLQLPEGELPTIGEQVRLLQQLRDRVSLQAASRPPLTEQQLQQMEQIFRRWKSESAEEFQLPDLDSIPQEWIEQAIADPQVRQQAERLLEQYAHDRQKSTSPVSSDEKSLSPQGEPRKRAGSGREQSTPGLIPPDRALPDAAKIKSLQELFKKLTHAEAIRTQGIPNSQRTTSPSALDRSQPRAGSNIPRNSVNTGAKDSKRDLNNNLPNSNLNRNSPNRYLPRSTDSNQQQPGASGERTTPSQASNSASSEQQPNLTEQIPDATGANAFDLATPEFAAPKENGGTNNGSTGNVADKPRSLNSEETADKRLDKRSLPRSLKNSTQPALRPEKSAITSPEQNSASNQSGEAMDIKSQIARLGVGATLQRIFKNAISEQKTQPANEVLATPMNQAGSHRVMEPPQTSALLPRQLPPSNTKTSAGTRSSTAQTQQTAAVSSEPSIGDNMRELALDIWKSISTVTQVPQLETASVPAPQATVSASESIGLTWRNSGWLLLALPVLALIFLAFAGRRMQQAATNKKLDAGWTAEILRAGVRTRTDVIRAFHHFALQRPQPVATWWNHRYVARRLSESSPQLSTAIQELTGLYEFARYQRPELELSPEQLLRVQTALRQCDA